MENNKQERNYIEILKNSMDRKEQVLEKILLANEEQKQVALEPKFDYDKFDDDCRRNHRQLRHNG